MTDEHAFTTWALDAPLDGYYARCRCLHDFDAPTPDLLEQAMQQHLDDTRHETEQP